VYGADLRWVELAAGSFSTVYRPPTRGSVLLPAAIDVTNRRAFGLDDFVFAGSRASFVSIDFETAELEALGTVDQPGVPSRAIFAGSTMYLTTVGFFGSGEFSLTGIDSVRGETVFFADDDIGSGPSVSVPIGLAIDQTRNRALMIDEPTRALIAINLNSGTRAIVSTDTIGSGPAWQDPYALRQDEAANLVYVVQGNSLIAADLSNGNRTVISSANVGGGIVPAAFVALSLDIARGRALVRDVEHGLLAVSLEDGERSTALESRFVPVAHPRSRGGLAVRRGQPSRRSAPCCCSSATRRATSRCRSRRGVREPL